MVAYVGKWFYRGYQDDGPELPFGDPVGVR